MALEGCIVDDRDAPREVLISAIEHYSYCPRQCALIHVEQVFEENSFTRKGQLAHERVNSGVEQQLRGKKTLRDVVLWSERYHMRGKSDVIEIRGTTFYPVEYKVGATLTEHAALQLCAQALCIEEMFNTTVPVGAVYCVSTKQRHEVVFDARLRQHTSAIIAAIREQLDTQSLPVAPNDRRCRACSLINVCLPTVVGEPNRVRGLYGALFQVWDEAEDTADA